MNDYRKMIESARQHGVTNEDKMWRSITAVGSLLDEIDDESAKLHFMRKQHEILYGRHYDELTAEGDVKILSWTDRDGVHHSGPHWSVQEVENGMRSMTMPACTTKWDKYVAANVMYADTCKVLSDDQILKAACSFFLTDEDWPNKDAKIWDYMSAREWYDTRDMD